MGVVRLRGRDLALIRRRQLPDLGLRKLAFVGPMLAPLLAFEAKDPISTIGHLLLVGETA